MLIKLLLRDPHLVESSQTSKDTSTNPRAKLPLRGVTRCRYSHARTGESLHKLLVQTIREAIEQAGSSSDNDVRQQVRADVNIDAVEGALDKFRDCLCLRRRGERRFRVGNRGFGVEQRFHHAVTVNAKELVVAVGELERSCWGGLGHFFVRNAAGANGSELGWAGPDLDDGFLELGYRALLEEGSVGCVWCLFGREGLVLGLRGLACLDPGLGGDEIVRRDGDRLGGVVLEQRADLRRDVIASQRRMLDTAFQDHAVMDWGHRDVGSADIDYKGRCLSCSKSERAVSKTNVLLQTARTEEFMATYAERTPFLAR